MATGPRRCSTRTQGFSTLGDISLLELPGSRSATKNLKKSRVVMIIVIMMMLVSLHRHDNGNFYPGTGGSTECGANVGLGTNINIAWSGKHLVVIVTMMMTVRMVR